MSNRPAIPIDIQREVLFESRHRCAVCCEPTPLEKAHIDPWNSSKDHSAPNLIALCPNCHTRADNEKWGEDLLKRYKKNPCALAANASPIVTPEKQAIIDLVINSDPESMTAPQRLRFVSMVAAYAGTHIENVRLLSLSPENSSRLRLQLPKDAAQHILDGFEKQDPLLKAFLDDFILLRAQPVMSNTSDISEKGLETIIMLSMTGTDGLAVQPGIPMLAGGTGYIPGHPKDYDRAHALDTTQLFAFLHATQPALLEKLALATPPDPKDINRLKFLARLSSEIGKRGVIDVLRHGIDHGPLHFKLFFATPSAGNATAQALHALNRFSLTRQLAYSVDETRRALDLSLFINGLPIATFELKNSLTRQTAEDAIQQYKLDRDPRERLFEFGRCAVHFAVDDSEVYMTTELKGKATWFLPFNKGYNDGAGNPPNPNGLKTDYLWKEILTPARLTDIIENYAQIVEKPISHSRKKKREQVWPRYHQLALVRKALAHVRANGAGQRYLIQHSAGSGKSNSIAWLAHQLISAKRNEKEVFDSVIVITDRTILDKQIETTIKGFMQVSATVGHADRSGDLRRFIEEGKKIIITTVQKFPFILNEIDAESDKTFAILIDEAHSSQGGKTSAAVSKALSGPTEDETLPDPEDIVNDTLEKRATARKMLTNASYFAFTATPKTKTLEMFGIPQPPDAEGKIQHHPFDKYTMKQAIQEGFILDVLQSYTPVESYYKLVKKVEDDPEFDTKKARKKLRRYVESHDRSIRLKTEIMVDHFHEQVIAPALIGGQARAMLVTSSVERAIQYFHAFQTYLTERKSPYQAIVAFSGEREYNGAKVSEATLNGFPSGDIPEKIQSDPYRFLICAEKFQTGYDEPLLHTMYVDKPLSGIQAVQTLSRLNRARPQKHNCFVLDFQNNLETITHAFQDYYRTTILAEETDPNKLHDLKADLDRAQVYSPQQLQKIVELFLAAAPRDQLDPILDRCVDTYCNLDEDEQVAFKGKAKSFCRTYDFLASVMPYINIEWEKLSILLNLLTPKLPAPQEDDLAKGIIQTIDMDSYRVEKKTSMKIALADQDAEIAPITETSGHKNEPELDHLSNIIKTFNEQFGSLITDADQIVKHIREDIAPKVAANIAYQNARENTPHTARYAHDQALEKEMQRDITRNTQFYKQFVENESFRRAVTDMVYALTSQ